MVSKRSITTSVLVAALGVGAGFAVMAPTDAAADDCGKYKTAKAKAACKGLDGKKGKAGVKKLMTNMKKKFKGKKNAKGAKFECKECHDNVKKGTLHGKTKTGGEDPMGAFKAWLAKY